MTTTLDNRIDEFISRVKKRGILSDFCFLPDYPPNKTPNPVKKYTVTVGNIGTKEKTFFIGECTGWSTRGRLYEVKLRLRIYAPSYTSGSSLVRACSVLADSLEAEDSEQIITGISFSGIGFDTSSRTEYRDVFVTLEMLQTEEAAS